MSLSRKVIGYLIVQQDIPLQYYVAPGQGTTTDIRLAHVYTEAEIMKEFTAGAAPAWGTKLGDCKLREVYGSNLWYKEGV